MNLSGKWFGEYSQLSGTVDPAPITYDSFEIHIIDKDGEIIGKGKDSTLESEPFSIQGFHENGMISFIKKYEHFIFQDEKGEVFGDDGYDSVEIHYQGRFNDKENLFQGTWEIHMGEEKQSLQESYTDKFERGEWYLRKTE